MKLKLNLLSLTLTSLLLPNVVFADDMPTVKVVGHAVMTYQPVSSGCADSLVANDCSAQNCNVSGKTLDFNKNTAKFAGEKCQNISITLQNNPGSACSNSQAEFSLSTSGSTYDISLVNGFSSGVIIKGGSQQINAMNPLANSFGLPSAGVYPYGCTTCTGGDSQKVSPCPEKPAEMKGCSETTNCQITNDSNKDYTVEFVSAE